MGERRRKKNDAKRAEAVGQFDIENPVLPDWIADNAFNSGGYPFDRQMPNKAYERELDALQHELVKVQDWVAKTGHRVVVVWEGRDAAGKGGTIKRFMQHLNPRQVRVVALPKPTERERGQWYFQRYVAELPTKGEIVFFDRSWYNRAGVEPVMGFCTPEEAAEFLDEVPNMEGILIRSGLKLFKFWLTIGREEQMKRLHERQHDPLKRWKLSAIDYAAAGKWEAYTRARETMFRASDTSFAPWSVIKANDKRRARIACMRQFLTRLDYDQKDESVVGTPDPLIVSSVFHDID